MIGYHANFYHFYSLQKMMRSALTLQRAGSLFIYGPVKQYYIQEHSATENFEIKRCKWVSSANFYASWTCPTMPTNATRSSLEGGGISHLP